MKGEAIKAVRCSVCNRVKAESDFNTSGLKHRKKVCKKCYNLKYRTPKAAWFYLITHPAYQGYVKPGKADDWLSRLNSYQTGCPFRNYTMEYKVWVEDVYFMEQYFKEKCAVVRSRDNGEWFNIPYYVAVEVAKAAQEEYKKNGVKALFM